MCSFIDFSFMVSTYIYLDCSVSCKDREDFRHKIKQVITCMRDPEEKITCMKLQRVYGKLDAS